MKLKYLLPLAGLLLAGCVTRTYTVAPSPAAPAAAGPTVAEVQSMVKAGISDTVIVNQIQNASTRYTLTVDQIIALKQAGASDTVLNALINSANKPAAQTSTTVIQTDTYPAVYPYAYVDPWPWVWWGWGGPYYYGGYYRGGYYYHGGGGWHGGGWHH